MPRRERQRQHQLVLDQRQRLDRRSGQHHFGVAVAVERRELALVAGKQHARPLVDRPLEILEAPLARQRHGSLNVDRQRQAARRVGRTLDAPFDLRRPVAQYVVDARQLVRIDRAFGDAALARELESHPAWNPNARDA